MVPCAVLTSPGQLIAADTGIEAKVSFLSQAEHYPERASCVETVETHLSWVFLTDRHAYKLKKPIRNGSVDLRTLAARQSNCLEEVRLNRRLTTGVYLGTIALRSGPDGALRFDASGVVVDWLVKMRRLPADRMLDRRLQRGSVTRADVDSLIARLCDFYRQCPPVGVLAAEYRRQFRDDISANQVALSGPGYGLSRRMIDDVCARQLAFLAHNAASLDERAGAGRIVEGHGDLRPEHICLESPLQIIDCLEFSRVLRTLDVADELGFLALECERSGAPGLRAQILDSYRTRSGDSPPDALVHFYQSHRACVRANLALRHLDEPVLSDPAAWRARAVRYLELAHEHAGHCNGSAAAPP